MHLSITFIQPSRGSIINTYVWKKYNFNKSQDRLAVGVIYPLFFLPLPLLLTKPLATPRYANLPPSLVSIALFQ